jgi:hypothetical protein
MAADVASTAKLDICMLRDELRCTSQVSTELKTDRPIDANPVRACMHQGQLLTCSFLKKERLKM